MGNTEKLNDEILENISGGVKAGFDERRQQFEAAWKDLGLDEKGYSGMKMAEVFDEWEIAGYKSEASVFLTQYKF